jgi:hypothetical protein
LFCHDLISCAKTIVTKSHVLVQLKLECIWLENVITSVTQAARACGQVRIAAQRGDAVTVQVLVRARADVDAADDGGVTPLMAAAECGHLAVVQARARCPPCFRVRVGRMARRVLCVRRASARPHFCIGAA